MTQEKEVGSKDDNHGLPRFGGPNAFANETILIEHINVYHAVNASEGSADAPDFSAMIQVEGAATIGTATTARIIFYPDGDSRIAKPRFDALNRAIFIYKPLSTLDAHLTTLYNSTKLYAVYYETTSGIRFNASLEGYNRIT